MASRILSFSKFEMYTKKRISKQRVDFDKNLPIQGYPPMTPPSEMGPLGPFGVELRSIGYRLEEIQINGSAE